MEVSGFGGFGLRRFRRFRVAEVPGLQLITGGMEVVRKEIFRQHSDGVVRPDAASLRDGAVL